MDDLLAQSQSVLAAQRKRGGSQSLQKVSNDLAASYFEAIPVIATQRSSRNRFNRYSAWCEAKDIPKWPIVGPIVALSIHDLASGDLEGGKAYDSHTTVLNALRRATESVWDGKPDCDMTMANIMSFEPLRDFCATARAAAIKKRSERAASSPQKPGASSESSPSKPSASKAKKSQASAVQSPVPGAKLAASTTPRKTPASSKKTKISASTTPNALASATLLPASVASATFEPATPSKHVTPAKARSSRKRKAEDGDDDEVASTKAIEPAAKRALLSPPESAHRTRRATASPGPQDNDSERKPKRKYVRKNVKVTTLDIPGASEQAPATESTKKSATPRRKKAYLGSTSETVFNGTPSKIGGKAISAIRNPVITGVVAAKEAVTDLVAENKSSTQDSDNGPIGVGVFGRITRWFGWGV